MDLDILLKSGTPVGACKARAPEVLCANLTTPTCGTMVHHMKTTEQVLAGFFRDLAASAVQVADELDPPPPADGGTDVSPLGFLQR